MSFPCCVVFHVLVAPMFKGHPHSTPAFHTRIPHPHSTPAFHMNVNVNVNVRVHCHLHTHTQTSFNELSKSVVRLALAALV
jgi:hypothetical protein